MEEYMHAQNPVGDQPSNMEVGMEPSQNETNMTNTNAIFSDTIDYTRSLQKEEEVLMAELKYSSGFMSNFNSVDHEEVEGSVMMEKRGSSEMASKQIVKQKQIGINDSNIFLVGNQFELQNSSEIYERLNSLMITLTSDSPIKIVRDAEVFAHSTNSTGTLLYITRDDLSEFLRMGRINLVIPHIFIKFLHKLCKLLSINESFGFMCPEELQFACAYKKKSSEYMSNALINSKSKKFIMAPYFHK
ncbi:hypothetical protein ACET3Z_007150 [Daucus carota]